MYTNNLDQIIKFGYFIIVGIILCIIFDIFRISRKVIKTSDLVTNMEDIFFGTIVGIIILFSIFYLNNGELRLYIFIGIIIGSIIYITYFSKYFININIYTINLIKGIFIYSTKPIIILFKFLKKIIFKPISFIIINLRKFLKEFFKKTLKNPKNRTK